MLAKCKTCKGRGVVVVPDVEVVTVIGISYKIHRTKFGSWVDTPCSCFGSLMRVHSTVYCPWAKKRGIVLA